MQSDDAVPSGALVPVGERLTLPNRGTTLVRRAPGPPGAPTVVLLHGWLATGALNWYRCFEPLSQHFNVVALDLRGHGQGIRSNRRFRLRDCAEDVATLITSQDLEPVIAVGYSMGGSIAQLLWRHHRPLVNGLVLAATGAEFRTLNRHKYAASGFLVAAAGTRVGAGATWLPRQLGKSLGTEKANDHSSSPLMVWGRQEVLGHSSRVMLEAAHAIANFSSKKWIDQIDVPTSVIVTEHDTAVMPQSQIRMAMAIPGAHINRIPGGHMSCIDPDFGRKLTDACLDVQHRIDAGYNPLRPDA